MLTIVCVFFVALCVGGSNAAGCPSVEVKPIRAFIGVSTIPETAGGKLRFCVRDDPNLPTLSHYGENENSLFPLSPNDYRNSLTETGRALASTMVGRNGEVIEADFFVLSDWLLDLDEEEATIGCLQAVKDGMCDVGLCGAFITEERTTKYNLAWIKSADFQMENLVVYPRSSACTTKVMSDLCGRRVYVNRGTLQHDEIKKLNLAGAVCANNHIVIKDSSSHFDHFEQECNNADSADPCYLIGGAFSYAEERCSVDAEAINGNCDTTRLYLALSVGAGWAVRDNNENLARVLTKARDTLVRANYISLDYYGYGYLDSKWTQISGEACLTKSEDWQSCATLSTCILQSGESRCACTGPSGCPI